MGTVSSSQNTNEDFGHLSSLPQNLRKLELKFDVNKEVNPNLRQLLFWSLQEIRGLYEKFQRRTNIPFIDKNLFCKVVPFTRTNAFFLFDHFSKSNKLLSIYEFLCVLTITSYTHYINKVHCSVSFEALIMKMYPSLEEHHLEIINFWIKQYNQTFQIDTKEPIELEAVKEEKNAQKRKRILPRSTMKRIKEIFDLLDEEKKGYLNFENLKRNYTYGFTPKELEDLFEQHDQDKDGKLQVEDFVRILLPPDYVIEEGDEN